MFNIGPMEFVVLALVGIVVLGPDRLPQFTRDAARLIRTLREMATGARQQLREELGPEFADIDLRNLDPRTAVQRAVFGDDMPDLRKYSPRTFVRDAVFGEQEPETASEPDEPVKPVSMSKPSANGASTNGASANGASANGASRNGARPRPRPRPRTTYDEDAT